MVRVLLLLEDYNELLFTETILKKVGFDVESAKNHLNLVEMLLGFNPEVLVVPGSGRRIHLADVLQQVRKQKRQPDIFVIGSNETVGEDDTITKTLAHPLNPKELLSGLAEYGGVDPEVLLDKYRRAQAEAKEIAHMQASASIEPEAFKAKNAPAGAHTETVADTNPTEKKLKIQLQPTTVTPEQRQERFTKGLQQVTPPSESTFGKDRVKVEKKSIRGSEKQDEQSLKLENERKEFLKTLTEITPVSSSGFSKKPN